MSRVLRVVGWIVVAVIVFYLFSLWLAFAV
jgi:hypothetical protein